MNKKKHILITGATGYIGQHLANELKKTYHVHALVRKTPLSAEDSIHFHVYQGLSTLHAIFSEQKIDTVFHLAAKAQYDWSEASLPEFIDANIELGSLILEVMSAYGCRKFLNTSTYWQEFSAQESTPICFYAATKKAFEAILDFYCFDKKVNAISLRLHDVYGPQDPRPKLFTQLKKSANAQEEIPLTAGEQTLYFTHVADVVKAYQQALQLLDFEDGISHRKYDVRGFSHTLRSAVETFAEMNSLELKINWGAQTYRKNQIMNPVLLDLLPGWQANTDIDTGFKDL